MHMLRRRKKQDIAAFPELMKRIGIVAPDTEFNRRAAAYAATAAAEAKYEQAKRKKRKTETAE
jgi:hypothetical protein